MKMPLNTFFACATEHDCFFFERLALKKITDLLPASRISRDYVKNKTKAQLRSGLGNRATELQNRPRGVTGEDEMTVAPSTAGTNKIEEIAGKPLNRNPLNIREISLDVARFKEASVVERKVVCAFAGVSYPTHQKIVKGGKVTASVLSRLAIGAKNAGLDHLLGGGE